MVLPVTSFFQRPVAKQQNRPALNSVPYSGTFGTSLMGPITTYRYFWNQFKKSPELVAVINVLKTDIIGERPRFTAPDGSQLGRNKRMAAEKFWRENRVKETMSAILFDLFVTGNGYGWIGKLSAEERLNKSKEIIDMLRAKYPQMKDTQYNELLIKTSQDEDLKRPKKFDYVASSTMNIVSTPYDILGYQQNIAGMNTFFKPEDIIHFRLNTMDGMVDGFTPLEALTAEVYLLYMIKQNMIAYMQNGGSPSKIFSLPNEIANSENHKFMVQTLQRYNMVENRNGNLVFTGELKVEDLAGNPKDMEYETMALYIASNIAFAFGIPVTRIPYLVGKSATGGDSGGMAEQGYWNMISEKQDLIEDLLNTQLFEQMGWNVRLNRKYKQDEVREAQTASMNADTVTKMQSILIKNKQQLTVNKTLELLGLSDDDIEEADLTSLVTGDAKTGLMNQNLLDNNSINKEPDNRKRADVKRNVANDKINKGAAV